MLPRLKQVVKRYPFVALIAGAAQRQANAMLARYPLSGDQPSFSGQDHLAVSKFASIEEYYASSELDVAAERDRKELAITPRTVGTFSLPGRCAICEDDRIFLCDFAYPRTVEGRLLPNWRESLLCTGCGFRNRVRGAFHVLLQEYAPQVQDRIYLTEQLTRTYRWFKGQFPNTIGSEFISSRRTPGSYRGAIRHEDMQNLSFDDASFDFIVSLDVLEHVPDLNASFSQIYRTLCPGGRLFFTAPMVLTRANTLTRAVLKGSKITHIEPPEYHGNPSNPAKGALCYRHFGWDVLDDLRAVGFHDAEVITWWSRELGYLQYPQYAITAVRPNIRLPA